MSLLDLLTSLKIVDKLIKSKDVHQKVQKSINKATNQQSESPTYITIDTKNGLEDAILRLNKKHCSQPKHTPWSKYPLDQIGRTNNFNIDHMKANEPITLTDTTCVEKKIILELLYSEDAKRYDKWDTLISFDEFISATIH